MTRQYTHLDAAQSAFFERELEAVQSKIYEHEYPPTKARTFIPSGEGVPAYASVIKWREIDKVGRAKVIAAYSDDLPMVDVYGTEHSGIIRSLGDGYEYSIMDVRAAAQAGVPLEARKGMAAREAIERLMDEILSLGDPDNNLPGFLTGASVPVINASQTWATANDPALWIKGITDAVTKIITDTNEVEAGPFDVLLPPEQYTMLAQTKNSTSSDATALAFLLSSNPYVLSVEPWLRTKGAGAGGTDRMVVYMRDPGKVEAIVPQEFEQLPAQEVNLAFKVPCHARVGGTVWHRPLSALYVDGI